MKSSVKKNDRNVNETHHNNELAKIIAKLAFRLMAIVLISFSLTVIIIVLRPKLINFRVTTHGFEGQGQIGESDSVSLEKPHN